MRYYFLHPKTLKTCDIYDGRSTWEDHSNKAEFIVVKEVGPAMQFYDEACDASMIDDNVIDNIEDALAARGYSESLVKIVINKLKGQE